MDTTLKLLMLVEVLVTGAVIGWIANRRQRIADVALYGVVGAILPIVTGIVGRIMLSGAGVKEAEILVAALPEWGGLMAAVPVGAGLLTAHLLTKKRDASAPLAGPKVLIVALAFLGATMGVLVSQYVPIFGGFLRGGEPWSPFRRDSIGIHVLTFIGLGGGLGFFLQWRAAGSGSGAK